MFSWILESSRYLTILVVVASMLSALTLLVYVSIGTVEGVSPASTGPLLALKFIKLVDVALLAMVFQLIAIGTYTFSSTRISRPPPG